MSQSPTKDDLAAVAAFAERFEAPWFSAGEALYDHNIVDPDSGYMEESAAEFVRRLEEDPMRIAGSDLATVRCVLTRVVRADRFVEGTIARASETGVAQAATKRLRELALLIAR